MQVHPRSSRGPEEKQVFLLFVHIEIQENTMKGIHSLAGLLLLIIVQGSWQIPLQETGDTSRLLKMTEAEPIDEPEELLNVKRHSQGTFTNEYNKYLEAKHAQEFVQWLIGSKRRGGLTRRHADGTYTSDISSFLQDQAAKEFVSWLKKGRGKRDYLQESIVADDLCRRHADGTYSSEIKTVLDSIAAKEFLNWVMNSKPSEASEYP
ncbi:glucagon-2-like [Huso huso]|uniref:Glucagon-2-like n=1 Tax=Huso huso TaxID=61971 RepID=A0ABR0ZE49_HUSHU